MKKMEETTEIETQSNSMFQDLKVIALEMRISAPLIIFFGFLLTYQLTIAPYRTYDVDRGQVIMRSEQLASLRPVLDNEKLMSIQKVTMSAGNFIFTVTCQSKIRNSTENRFLLPSPYYDSISVRWFDAVNKYGNFDLPQIFYEGVLFGITSENSHNIEFTARNKATNSDLYNDLLRINPPPTNILPRSAICNQTDWIESGFAVYYSYRHLKEHGKLSSDSLLPWKRIVEEVLNVARKHSQTYITVWYPSTFGKSSDVYNHMHQVIIQKIIPTRTGLNLMSSTVVVWLAKVNDTKPIVHPKTYRKPWTKEDHWTKYKSEINSSTKSFDIAVEAA